MRKGLHYTFGSLTVERWSACFLLDEVEERVLARSLRICVEGILANCLGLASITVPSFADAARSYICCNRIATMAKPGRRRETTKAKATSLGVLMMRLFRRITEVEYL